MSERPEVSDLVRQWIQKADNDLKTAEHTLLLGDECPYDSVCFHAQQSVEKCLKAILVSLQIPFQKTHDLEALSLLLPASFVMPVAREDLARLTPHATHSRYPEYWGSPSKQEAEWAVQAARRTRHAVQVWLFGG